MNNIASLKTSELSDLISKYSPFFHEIRKRIVFTIAVFVIGTLIGFILYDIIIKFLIDLLSLKGINIVFTSPFQFINLAMTCGIVTGLVLVFPLLIYQIMSFLKPALRNKEYKMIVRFMPFSLLLFLSGFIFGFFIMKWQIEIFLSKSQSLGIGNILDISRLLSTILVVSVFMGLAFQFPLILLLLSRLGVMNRKQLNKHRMWVYLGSFIFAILLPPDSILADIFLALPIVILFELTLLLIGIIERKKDTSAPLVQSSLKQTDS